MRHAGIELGRLIAVFFVVYIHIRGKAPNHVINAISSFAVPYFFVASGFFFSRKVDFGNAQVSELWKLCRRVLLISLPWYVVYSVLPCNWLSALLHSDLLSGSQITASLALQKITWSPINFLFDGPPGGFHLWFLPALLSAGVLMWLCVRAGSKELMWSMAIGLYIIGLAGGIFKDASGFDMGFNTRNGPYQSFLIFAAGWQLGRIDRAPGVKFAISTVLLGVSIYLIERLLPISAAGFSASALPIGVGVFLLFANLKTDNHIFVRLGSYALTIYLIHIILRGPVCSVLHKVFPGESVYVLWFVLFGVSLAVAFVVKKGSAKHPRLTHPVSGVYQAPESNFLR